MEPLRTLVFAGLRKDKGTFIGLALLLSLTALALTLTTSLFVNLSEREEALLDQVAAGDVFANDLVANLTDEDVQEIGALPAAEEVEVTEAFAAPTRVEDARGSEIVKSAPPSSSVYEAWGASLDFNVLDDDLSSYRDAKGGPTDDEAYVRVAEHALHNIQIGDFLVLDIGGRETPLRVAGFHEDPQMGTPFMETKRYLLSAGTFEKLLAWRAIISEKGRYAGIGICSLLLCAFVALCLGIGGEVAGDDAVYKAFGVWKSDGSVRFDGQEVSLGEVRETIEGISPITHEWEEGAAVLNLNGEACTFVGLSDTGVLEEASVVSGRAPKHDNEALVGLSLARTKGLSVGDELQVEKGDGEERTYIVSGLLSSVLNSGNSVVLTYEGLQELAAPESEGADVSRQYQLADPDKADEVAEALASRFGDSVDTELTGLFGSATNMLLLVRDMLTVIGYAMSAFALVLACVAVMLVSRRTLLSERRDMGIYRALGFTVASLRASFTLRFLGVSAVGALTGSALTMAAGGALISVLFGLFGVGGFSLALPVWEAIAISAVFALAFALSAFGMSRRIKDVSIRELVVE